MIAILREIRKTIIDYNEKRSRKGINKNKIEEKNGLTKREQQLKDTLSEIKVLLNRGKRQRVIAKEFDLNVSTISRHVKKYF